MSGAAGDRMERAVEAFVRDLAGFRTGRANAALLERVTVDVYGAATPLKLDRGFKAMDTFTWRGREFWCLETISHVVDDEGQTTQYVAVMEDATERKLAEEQG